MTMSNSVDSDETTHYEPSHLDLRCLQKPIIIASVTERVRTFFISYFFTFIHNHYKKNNKMDSLILYFLTIIKSKKSVHKSRICLLIDYENSFRSTITRGKSD